MLVPGQLIEVTIMGNNIEHYKNLGYDVKFKDTIYVPPEHLTPSSHKTVSVQCDLCKTIVPKTYEGYVQQHTYGLDTCNKCKNIKRKQTSLRIYGTDNPNQSQQVKDKYRNTCLNRYGCVSTSQVPEVREKITQTFINNYGVDNPMKDTTIKNKLKETFIENYGVDNPQKYKEIREKTTQTCIEKYGTKLASQNQDVKKKVQQVCIEKYGYDNPMKNTEIQNKLKETMLEKYGVENPFSSNQVKEKIKQTMLEKYNVEHYSQSLEFKEKYKQTSLERYGVQHPFQNDEIKNKATQTLCGNGKQRTSSQQLQLYEIIKRKYSNAELNYPFGSCSLDIFICINNINLDIEYDGWYWHQNKQVDLKRDKFLQSQGFKTLRIKSGTLLPTEEELFGSIDYLVNTEHHFKEIILSDWKEGV